MIIQELLLLFILSMIFTNAFAVSSFVNIPTSISSLLLFLFFIKTNRFIIPKRISPLIIYLIILTFSSLLFSENSKSINHWFMWTYAFLIFYFVIGTLMISITKQSPNFFNKILGVLSFTVFFASTFAIAEFYLVNYLSIDLSKYIYRGTVQEYTPLSLSFIRARSFMEESGQFAFFLECFAPITIAWIIDRYKTHPIVGILFVSIIVCALFLTFSAFGFISIFVSVSVFMYYYLKYSWHKERPARKIFFLIFCFALAFVLAPLAEQALEVINIKLDNSSSVIDRTERIEGILPHLKGLNLFIGYGAAPHETLGINSFVSSYIVMLMSAGILGLLLFISFIVYQLIKILAIKNYKWRCCLILSFVLPATHMLFMDMIIYPWFWFMISLIYCFKEIENVKN